MTPIAWVGDEPVLVSEVDNAEAELRSGRAAATLPAQGTSEARQLRRWLVQRLTAERIVGLMNPHGEPPALEKIAADRAAMLELGSVAASLLTGSPQARSVFVEVTAGVAVSPDEVVRYYEANFELFSAPERRVVRHRVLPTPDLADLSECPLRTVVRGQLAGPVERALFAAAERSVVGPVQDPLGWHTLFVERAYPENLRTLAEAREEITAHLLAAARRRAFGDWLEARRAELVRLAPGYEHPGDPRQPDNTHRH
ncbi:peptidylprolyl isomerase [Allokutzneria oryzae]|uniref:Malonyl CoA-ACP transacylase n=1 Tax=Allokutzneria oryzae TaxID=1378989 RepID=A0ABV6A239_9PSEU